MKSPSFPEAAFGPLRTFAPEALLSGFGGAPTCRVPARRPGNFHLRPQMKVTKAKGPNATPVGAFFSPCPPGPAGHLETPKRFMAAARSTGPRFASALGPADQRGRGFARPAPPSAQQVRSAALDPSGPLGRGSAACRTHERCCVEALCFGDFHLGLQMKVTRPPGRDPAGNADHHEPPRQDKPNVRNGPQADRRGVRVTAAQCLARPKCREPSHEGRRCAKV